VSGPSKAPAPGRRLAQRLLALGGLVVIVGVAVLALVLLDVIGGEGGGEGIAKVEFLDPPRAAGQEDLVVGVEEGQLAPDFLISDFDGVRHKLSEFRGRVVYVNFWATWCGPCVFELPEIYDLQQRNSQDLAVIAVNRRQSVAEAKGFLGDRPRLDGGAGVSFSVNGLDPDDRLYDRFVRLFPEPMPVSVFINPEGVVSAVFNGFIRLPQMEQAVTEALASTSAASAVVTSALP